LLQNNLKNRYNWNEFDFYWKKNKDNWYIKKGQLSSGWFIIKKHNKKHLILSVGCYEKF
jgi:hypothetical protein